MKRSRLIAGVLALIMGVSSFPTASVMNVSAAETYVAEEAEDAADEATAEQEVSQNDSSDGNTITEQEPPVGDESESVPESSSEGGQNMEIAPEQEPEEPVDIPSEDEIDVEEADSSATEEIANVYSTTVPAHNEAKLSGDETEGQDAVTVDYEFSFNEVDKTATVTGYSGEGGQLVIPDTVVVKAGTTEIVALDSDAKEGEEAYTVTAIGNNAFEGNTSITGISFAGDSVSLIGSSAFYNCKGLMDLSLPEGLEKIENYAFQNCSSLSGVLEIPAGVTEIGVYAFSGCSGFTGTLEIPAGVTAVSVCLFSGCSGFTGLILPEGLETVGSSAFNGCSGLTGTLEIPDSVTELGTYAFYGCRNIEEVVIGSGMVRMQGYSPSFWGCSGVKTMTILAETPPYISNGSDQYSYVSNFFRRSGLSSLETIWVPEGTYSAYVSAYGNGLRAGTRIRETGSEDFIIENGVLTAYVGDDTVITVPEEVKEIGASAFRNNSTLESVTLPEGLEKIGAYAFQNCTGLKGELEIPSGVTEIGAYAFSNCAGLTGGLEIPSGVTEISSYAFNNCKGLTGLSLPEGLEKIGTYAFQNCTGLTGGLEIPAGVTEIGAYAFSGCSGLTGDLEIPSGVKAVGYYSFYGCSGLKGTLEIPDSVTSIDSCAFAYCRNIEEVVIGGGMVRMQGYNPCFLGCSAVKTMTILAETPPYISDGYNNYSYASNLFGSSGLSSLETIYVLPESLDAYKTAYSNIPSRITITADTLTIPVSKLSIVCAASSSAEISWNPAISESVIGYRVYRDDTLVSDTENTNFYENGLEEDTTYEYSVVGYTEAGEETAPARISVTTKGPDVISVNSENGYHKVGLTKNKLVAVVADTKNLKDAVGRFYYFDNYDNKMPISTEIGEYSHIKDGQVSYSANWNVSALEANTYEVVFELTDRDGKTASASANIEVENSVPEAVSSLTAVGDTNQIVLSWSMAHEIDTQKYNIYRRSEEEDEFKLIKKIFKRDILSYTDTKADKPQKYYYYITTVNSLGTEGAPSQTAVAIPRTDTEAPRVVQMTPVNGSVIGGNVEFYANAQDNVAVVKTEIYLSTDDGESWELLSSTKNNYSRCTLDTKLIESETIKVKGVAYDAAENQSTDLIYVYRIDNIGPEKVTGLSYESTATTITLKWNDVADEDFAFFRVEQQVGEDEFVKVQDVNKTLGVNIYGLQSDTEYTYRVTAYDQLGNRGEESDLITAATQRDTQEPVVTAILPSADYYNSNIPVRITAKDNTAISSMVVQYSRDAVTWTDYETIEFSGNKQTETASVTFDIESIGEGAIYIRGVAEDIYGNTGDSSQNAPYVQYIIDLTAPSAPSGVNTNAITGAIEIKWDMGTEEDIDDYIVYRSTDGENFTKLAEKLYSVNYWDRSAEKDQVYYYKVAVRDQAGNISEDSEVVSISLPLDTEEPRILSFVPEDGSLLGPSNREFKLLASDNWRLSSVLITYTVNDFDQIILLNVNDIKDYYKLFTANLPIESFKDGDVIKVTATVTDAQGLSVTQSDITYTVDKTAPRVSNVMAEGSTDHIAVTWNGNEETDLAGYRIYRKTANGNYSLIAQKAVNPGASAYFYEDYNAQSKETYYYKVEALDRRGNSYSKETEAAWLITLPEVKAALSAEAVMELDVEYYFDGTASFADLGIAEYEFDFGDGTVVTGTSAKVVHKYVTTGEYKVKLTVTDTEGSKSVAETDVKVEEARLLGSVSVKVVDASGTPIVGMPVYFDIENTSENVSYTNDKGLVSFIASAGAYMVGAYGDGYLPVKSGIAVRAGTETNLTLTMVNQPIVTGEFEVNRMTLDEIIAAGIDVTDPANQQVVRMIIHLEYGNKPITMNVVTNGTQIYSGETTIVETSEGRRQLTATMLQFEGSSSGGSGSVNLPPSYSVVAIMDIPVEASYLKEFFDVKLHIVNNADPEFVLSHNTVTLNIPDGMSLVDSLQTLDSNTFFFDQLAGQEQTTLAWILRGDEAGEYDLTADYSAVLEQFNQPVTAVFKTENPIKVNGLEAMKIIADINTRVINGGLYFDLSLQNVGTAEMYLPNIKVADSVLIEYEKSANASEGNEFTPAVKRVKAIGAEIRNSSGYVQTLDALDYSDLEVGSANYDEQIRERNIDVMSLAVGEMLTRKYVCYDSISSDDIAYLVEAIYKVAEDYGIQVQINRVDMDLYDNENADEKAESFYTDATKRALYEYFTDYDNDNFYYYMQALKDDNDTWKKLGEAFYRSTDCVLNLNWNLFTNEDVEDITRKYVVQLLEDEGFSSTVEQKVDDKFLKVTKSVLSTFKSGLPDTEVERGFAELVDTLSNGETVRSLAGTLKNEGSDAFYDRLIGYALSTEAGVVIEYVKNHYSRDDISGWLGEAISGEISDINTVLGHISTGISAWNKSVELTNQLMTISAAHSEAEELFAILENHPEINGIVYEEIKKEHEGLLKGYEKQCDIFVEEFMKAEATGQLAGGFSSIVKVLDKAYGIKTLKTGTVISAIKLGFNTMNYVFNWKENVSALQELRVSAALTHALRSETIQSRVSNDSEHFLDSLKYLIKMRIEGEKAYIGIVKGENREQEILGKINAECENANFENLNEYYDMFRTRAINYRDILYSNIVTVDGIPIAPVVDIDYSAETIREALGANYEYSFDGENWTVCDDQKLALNPGTIGRHLWVRRKESSENLAGNITKLYVPQRPRMSTDVTAKYKAGVYYIDGLEGDYVYALTDVNNAGTELDQTVTVDGAETAQIANDQYYPYMVIAKDASMFSFRSYSRVFEVEKAVLLTTNMDSEAGEVTGAGEYWIGETAHLKATLNPAYRFEGWYKDGMLLSMEEEIDYEVDGDASIEARTKIKPVITKQPEDVSVYAGEKGVFTIEATGEDLQYRWQRSTNGKKWVNCGSRGCKTDTFGFTMEERFDGRLYRCMVTDGTTEIYSNAVRLNLLSVEITKQPENISVYAGEETTLTVTAAGDNLKYRWQWSKNDSPWKNCTSVGSDTDTFAFVMEPRFDGRKYRCVITRGKSQIFSDAVDLTLKPLSIVKAPEDVRESAGKQVTLKVEVDGMNVQYQWERRKSATGSWRSCFSEGCDTDTFSFELMSSYTGRQYRCKITNGYETVYTEPINIEVE